MGSMHGEEREKPDLNLEATELRLGLPGGGGGGSEVVKKRGFAETVDLKLNLLSGKEGGHGHGHGHQNKVKEKNSNARLPSCNNDPAKAQVVGWPPVRSFRKNMLAGQKGAGTGSGEEVVEKTTSFNAAFVKVSMDGAPYLRKVDLKMYSTYRDLANALGNLFSSFTIGNCGSQGMKDFMNESKLMDLLNGFDYVSTYEDKDGDWMLVGDVPWKMFVDSCKRLRIMKGKEAIGLAPRAMEKCKSRS